MVQQNSASESTLNKSQSFASNGKDERDMFKDEIKSHLDKILDHLNNGETRYAFHEADTTAHKLRDLCNMEAAD